jgi:hypothetical protein
MKKKSLCKYANCRQKSYAIAGYNENNPGERNFLDTRFCRVHFNRVFKQGKIIL